MKDKKIALTTILIMFTILIVFVGLSIGINQYNKKLKAEQVDIVIYRCEVKDFNIVPTGYQEVYYRAVFNKELIYDEVIYMIDSTENYNRVIIKNGIISVTEANCFNHICQNTKITYNITNCQTGLSLILNPVVITCEPHGLIIRLERSNA